MHNTPLATIGITKTHPDSGIPSSLLPRFSTLHCCCLVTRGRRLALWYLLLFTLFLVIPSSSSVYHRVRASRPIETSEKDERRYTTTSSSAASHTTTTLDGILEDAIRWWMWRERRKLPTFFRSSRSHRRYEECGTPLVNSRMRKGNEAQRNTTQQQQQQQRDNDGVGERHKEAPDKRAVDFVCATETVALVKEMREAVRLKQEAQIPPIDYIAMLGQAKYLIGVDNMRITQEVDNGKRKTHKEAEAMLGTTTRTSHDEERNTASSSSSATSTDTTSHHRSAELPVNIIVEEAAKKLFGASHVDSLVVKAFTSWLRLAQEHHYREWEQRLPHLDASADLFLKRMKERAGEGNEDEEEGAWWWGAGPSVIRTFQINAQADLAHAKHIVASQWAEDEEAVWADETAQREEEQRVSSSSWLLESTLRLFTPLWYIAENFYSIFLRRPPLSSPSTVEDLVERVMSFIHQLWVDLEREASEKTGAEERERAKQHGIRPDVLPGEPKRVSDVVGGRLALSSSQQIGHFLSIAAERGAAPLERGNEEPEGEKKKTETILGEEAMSPALWWWCGAHRQHDGDRVLKRNAEENSAASSFAGAQRECARIATTGSSSPMTAEWGVNSTFCCDRLCTASSVRSTRTGDGPSPPPPPLRSTLLSPQQTLTAVQYGQWVNLYHTLYASYFEQPPLPGDREMSALPVPAAVLLQYNPEKIWHGSVAEGSGRGGGLFASFRRVRESVQESQRRRDTFVAKRAMTALPSLLSAMCHPSLSLIERTQGLVRRSMCAPVQLFFDVPVDTTSSWVAHLPSFAVFWREHQSPLPSRGPRLVRDTRQSPRHPLPPSSPRATSSSSSSSSAGTNLPDWMTHPPDSEASFLFHTERLFRSPVPILSPSFEGTSPPHQQHQRLGGDNAKEYRKKHLRLLNATMQRVMLSLMQSSVESEAGVVRLFRHSKHARLGRYVMRHGVAHLYHQVKMVSEKANGNDKADNNNSIIALLDSVTLSAPHSARNVGTYGIEEAGPHLPLLLLDDGPLKQAYFEQVLKHHNQRHEVARVVAEEEQMSDSFTSILPPPPPPPPRPPLLHPFTFYMLLLCLTIFAQFYFSPDLRVLVTLPL